MSGLELEKGDLDKATTWKIYRAITCYARPTSVTQWVKQSGTTQKIPSKGSLLAEHLLCDDNTWC